MQCLPTAQQHGHRMQCRLWTGWYRRRSQTSRVEGLRTQIGPAGAACNTDPRAGGLCTGSGMGEGGVGGPHLASGLVPFRSSSSEGQMSLTQRSNVIGQTPISPALQSSLCEQAMCHVMAGCANCKSYQRVFTFPSPSCGFCGHLAVPDQTALE